MNAQDLKNSILQIAVQGKLVEQREEEGTAKELVEQIQEEKERLIREGKIKKEKKFPEITEDEIPFDIPQSWEWVRIGDVFNITMGQSPKGTSVFEGNDGIEFHQGKVFFGENYIQISNQSTNKPTKVVEPNTVLLCVRAPVGILNITRRQICIGRGLCGINTLAGMNEHFVLHILRAFKNDFVSKATGTTFVAITGEVVKNQIIPLPPLEEQKRIVTKIEELMPFVEKYDKAYSEVEKLNKKFPEDMQKSILQYAIQGKLVEQREEEGTAEKLYQQIQEEKAKLFKEGKIKKEKPLPEISEDEIPFDIPDNWKWVKLRDVCALITCGYASTPTYVSADVGMPFISAKNVKPYKFMPEEHNYITKELYDKLTKTCNPQKGDILLTRVGAGIGEAAIIDQDFPFAIYVSLTLIKLVNYELLDNKYILYWLNSPIGVMSSIKNIFGKGASQGNLNVKNVRNFLLPLPPLEEQKRIVAKIEKLLPYTKQLVKE